MKGYDISRDYKHLKELLDNGYEVVIVWIHSTTQRTFSGIARKQVSHDSSGAVTIGYHLDGWSWFPGISPKPFEDKCKEIGFGYIVPGDKTEDGR